MRFSLTSLFDLGELSADLRRSLGLVYASSLMVIMGTNLVQQVLPAMTEPLGVDRRADRTGDRRLHRSGYRAGALLGVAADRYGGGPLLIGGLILFGAAGTAVAAAPGFGWVLVLRTVQGIGFSAVIP